MKTNNEIRVRGLLETINKQMEMKGCVVFQQAGRKYRPFVQQKIFFYRCLSLGQGRTKSWQEGHVEGSFPVGHAAI